MLPLRGTREIMYKNTKTLADSFETAHYLTYDEKDPHFERNVNATVRGTVTRPWR